MLFESRENRFAIWDELKRLNYFSGFKASSKDEVRRLLDNAITMVAIQKPQLSVQDKNSEVISQMMANRDLFTSNERELHTTQSSELGTITAEGMRELREQEFSRQLGRHQAEFDSIINQGRPENIDFSDKTQEKKIGGEMESLVARAQQMRQMDLETVAKMSSNRKPDEVEKWINGGRPLKIEQDSYLPVDAQPLTPRKVRFSDSKPESKLEHTPERKPKPQSELNSEPKTEMKNDDDIFSRLKTKQPSTSQIQNIEKRLDNVERKLETILEAILFIRQNLISPTAQNAEENTEHLS